MAKKKNEISVNEFKSWIAGIQDMQEAGWSPNKQQWEKIRSKIDLLAEPDPADQIMVAPQPQMQRAPEQPVYQQPVYQQPQQYEWPIEQPSDIIGPSPITYTNGEVAQFI